MGNVLFSSKTLGIIKRAFDLADILSACEPIWSEKGTKKPADLAMIEDWNKAIAKFKDIGRPGWKQLNK